MNNAFITQGSHVRDHLHNRRFCVIFLVAAVAAARDGWIMTLDCIANCVGQNQEV